MLPRKLLCVLLLALTAIGCAKARLQMPDVTDGATKLTALRRVMTPGKLPPSRRTPVHERFAVVNRIDRKVRKGAIEVCQRTFNHPHICAETVSSRTLAVAAEDERINAYVGNRYNITVLGGLVAVAGSDDEIAAVLAHEYSHAFMGHVAKSNRNTVGGMLLGAAIGATVGAATGDPEVFVNLGKAGVDLGGQFGQVAYSKDMEYEADHLGMFILHAAGYDIKAASAVMARLEQVQQQRTLSGDKGVIGIFQTHPRSHARIQQMVSLEKLIEQGADRPVWKAETKLREKLQKEEAKRQQKLVEKGSERNRISLDSEVHVAAATGDIVTVRQLLENGTDPNARSIHTNQLTPLHLAAESGEVEIVRLLLDKGADADGQHKFFSLVDRSPLHLAAAGNHATVARLLLERGGKVNARTSNWGSHTPLSIAYQHESLDVACVLLEHGAALTERKGTGLGFQKKLLRLAIHKGHTKLENLLAVAIGPQIYERTDGRKEVKWRELGKPDHLDGGQPRHCEGDELRIGCPHR